MDVNSGDVAWVLASTALVLLMTPGLAFFYGGMTKAKSTLNMMHDVVRDDLHRERPVGALRLLARVRRLGQRLVRLVQPVGLSDAVNEVTNNGDGTASPSCSSRGSS